MKKTVSLARALKEKNRVAGRLAKSRALVNEENSKIVGATRDIDVKAVYESSLALRDRLIAIKAAIAIANGPIVSKIIELDEVRSEIAFLNKLNVSDGKVVKPNDLLYSDRGPEVSAVIRRSDVIAEVARLQKRAEELQDELDEFNASAKVEIDIGD